MQRKKTQLQTPNLDVAEIVKQAQLMRSQAVAEMISAAWSGAQRIATKLVNTANNDRGIAVPDSTHR